MARPSKFTPEIIETIIKAVSIGATYKDASQAAGVDYDTFNEWMKAGREGKRKFSEFSDAIEKAESNARNNYLSTIAQAAAKGDWKAAAWYLSHRAKSDYGDNVDVTSGGKEMDVKFDYSRLLGNAVRPVQDSEPPSADEDSLHGQKVGKDNNDGNTGG